MAAGSYGKVVAMTVTSDHASNGSNLLTLKPMPLSSWPSSTAVQASSTSSKPAPHLRPAVFRSLLYEACGRIVNPVYGSVGLLWSGNWAHCQAAVDAVLRGTPIIQMPSAPDSPPPHLIDPLKTYDIRHVSKDPNSLELNKVKNRTRFKGSVSNPSSPSEALCRVNHGELSFEQLREPWLSQLANGDSSRDDESMFSVETVEDEPNRALKFNNLSDNGDEVGLDLTLGLVPVK
ncbi:hypothetical protein GH714_041087 [Hevea brasiliensis]|uniref:LOB domain-containing protein n=1 Tax=Hevea brasiliensis TaxID=3981 RepID=A0A6A6MZ99_HEVBR|nr:hypothetical protein GH714_041087 [Hevea brasiliensis]